MKIIVGLILAFCICVPVNAQPLSTVDEFIARLDKQSVAQTEIHKNLLQMVMTGIERASISENDSRLVNFATARTSDFGNDVGFLLTLSNIHLLMRDGNDVKVVKRFFDLRCQATVKRGDDSIYYINGFYRISR